MYKLALFTDACVETRLFADVVLIDVVLILSINQPWHRSDNFLKLSLHILLSLLS